MPDPSPEERRDEAEARKAEAAARKAEAEAAKAVREQAEWESELAREAREAKLRQTVAEADDKAREAGHTPSDELALEKLEAETKQAVAEAAKKTAEAERARFSALIPDFSKIETGETKIQGDKPAFAALLGRMTLQNAAKNVVEKLELKAGEKILITTDADLVSTDVVYLEVVSALEILTKSARDLLDSVKDQPQAKKRTALSLLPAAAPIAGAIAAALPGFLSLFSANRTLSSFAQDADTTAAVAVVTAKILQEDKNDVQLDDFRLVSGGEVLNKETSLRDIRSKLVNRRLELEHQKSESAASKKAALERIAQLKKDLAKIPDGDARKDQIQTEIDAQQAKFDSAKEAEKAATVRATYVGETITGIDAFLGALHTVPQGGKRSPFAIAVLRQQLHLGDRADDNSDVIHKILFIQSSAGSVDQLLNDRPLLMKDLLHLIGSVSVTYWLLDTAANKIVSSGVASGIAQIRATIGKKLDLDPKQE